MPDRFSDHLRRLADDLWEAQHTHPFVRGIGDGTLDVEKFKFWVRQDYLFLIGYARLLAMGVVRAPDLETSRRFSDLTHATLGVEMELHRGFAAEFGITKEELEAEEKASATRAYTDFLLNVATTGDFPELVAALLPCIWGFCEVGQRLTKGPRPPDKRSAKWIEMYSSSEFAALATWCRELTDRVAEGLPPEALRRMERAFMESSRHELRFWEMGWAGA